MTRIWHNATLATLSDEAPERVIERGALVVEQNHIVWVGAYDELPREYRRAATTQIDVAGALITPGLID